MTKEFPATIAALLDSGADAASLTAAIAALGSGREHGIKTKTSTTTDYADMKCKSGWARQTCVHIEFDNGDILDRCGPRSCV